MNFKLAARIVAVILGLLFIIFAILPAFYAPLYGVAAGEGAQFMTRRAAPMFLAPIIILWVAADAPFSQLRTAVAWGVAALLLGIAFTGLLAFVQGIAAPVILLAAIGECAMATALIATRKN